MKSLVKPLVKRLVVVSLFLFFAFPVLSQDIFSVTTSGDVQGLEKLIKKTKDLNIRNEQQKTALLIAAESNRKDCFQILLDAGADPEIPDYSGWFPIHYCVVNGNTEILDMLLAKGANVNARISETDETPLITAAQNCGLNIIKTLLEKGAELDAQDKSQRNAFMHACYCPDLEPIKYLHEKGADISKRDKNEHTALIIVTHEGFLDHIKYLLDNGADVNAGNHRGDNALNYAAQDGSLEIVKYLVERGADVDTVNRIGQNALMYAAIKGELEIVRFFVEKSVDIQAATKFGKTALMFAVINNNRNVVGYLIGNGANINAMDIYNKSILDLADSLEMKALLAPRGAKTGEQLMNEKK